MARFKLFGFMALAAAVGFGAVIITSAFLKAPGGGDHALAAGDVAGFLFSEPPTTMKPVNFLDPEDREITLEDFKGRTILLNLWATWCAPCIEELPTLDALQADLGSDGFEVVTISIDRGRPDKPRDFFTRLGVTHLKLYRDPSGKIGLGLKAHGLPTTLLIDPKGREIGRLVGPADWNAEDAKALIQAHLPAQDPAG